MWRPRPGQVWCWDVTFLPARVQGRWFYLYLILDLFSRKVVGFEVHETDQAEHAAHLVRRTALAEGIHARALRPVLHGDNGAELKGTTVLAMLHWLGIAPSYSRPRVSDDNAFAEALFRTAKYRPEFPRQGLRRPRRGAAVGRRLRALVQPRAPSQRHPLRHPGAAPCRRGSRPARRPPRSLPAGARAQSAPLERADPRTGRRSAPSRSTPSATASSPPRAPWQAHRLSVGGCAYHRQDRRPHYETSAATTLTCAGKKGIAPSRDPRMPT